MDAYFNPRSRKGSDKESHTLPADVPISIHAPAKGATCFMYAARTGAKYFNPRSRKGSDDAEAEEAFEKLISIHAPAKGATASI